MPPKPNSSTDEILLITIRLIAEHDVAGVSTDMVAEAAGVSKATLYRRWPSRDALVFDALAYIEYPQANPDTGSLREDLAVLLADLVGFLNRPEGGKVFAAFLNSALRDAKLAELRARVSREAREPYRRVISRALARGELRPDVDAGTLVELLIAPFVYRRVGSPDDVPGDLVPAVIDLVLRGSLA